VHVYSRPVSKPAAVIAGGETTVTVRGSGIGGRNQELCLSLAIGIKGLTNTVATCFATDGIDGISPATGAIVDGETVDNALKLGLDPQLYLENNDSYTFFSKLGQSIITGYTGTNVNDIFIALIK
ncbi:MAG: MOFRL family protein, partial [Ignisphaera sp.]